MPRTYDRNAPPAVKVHVVPQPIDPLVLEKWEDGKLLHDVSEASVILSGLLGKGYSDKQIYRIVDKGQWAQGVHYFKHGRFTKLNLKAVIDWQVRQYG